MSEDTVTKQRAGTPLTSAKTPVGTGAVQLVGIVLALGLTALGVAAVRDALVGAGALQGTPWLTGTLARLDGLEPAAWTAALAVLVVLVGLWLVMASVRPRPRTGLALRSTTGVFLRPRDVSRLSVAVAEEVDGVLDASASTKRRSVSLRITTTGDTRTPDAVQEAVVARLSHLDPAPAVRVRTTTEGSR